MVDRLGFQGDDKLFRPLLLPGGGDDNGDPVVAPDVSPEGPRDSAAAAAARVVSESRGRRAPGADAAKRRRRLFEEIRRQSHGISKLIDEINDQMENAERGGRGGGRASTDEDDSPRRRMEFVTMIMTKASVLAFMITAGITAYLATLWYSLSVTVQCLVVVTFAWLAGVLVTILLDCHDHSRGAGEEEVRASDSSPAGGQPLEVVVVTQ